MPLAPPRSCRAPRCPHLVTDTQPCPVHPPRRPWSQGQSVGRGSTRGWRALRHAVLAQAEWRCQDCGGLATEVDHVVSLRVGGTDAFENLRALCGVCHAAKTARDRWR